MKKLWLAAAAIAALSTGCLNRRLVRMQDHPSQPVLLLETADVYTALFFPTRIEHVFWQCAETGNQLTCQRACGGPTEFQCPQGAVGLNATSSNVR